MELNWTMSKPSAPGAYWVRGYDIGRRSNAALVVVSERGGELFSNLHSTNSDSDDEPTPLANHSDGFEWCGPLLPADAPALEVGTTEHEARLPAEPSFAPPTFTVDEPMVERAARARIPGGSEAWIWLFNCEGGNGPQAKHLDWFRHVLTGALASRPANTQDPQVREPGSV